MMNIILIGLGILAYVLCGKEMEKYEEAEKAAL